ncbi:hypothetical protein CWI38_0590p0020 [Hamiltosporidium tvaerminnensis]|uniref:UspA domain-containing protein n=1 Tax=Hamiltosporidium tvaerminnensis TaxID=1176355 RepID=A0A4Q9LW00_9MICR|nr:hypothetical protein CWI38_0590p0020 [Hamiltosporidium tvaerminnensis]
MKTIAYIFSKCDSNLPQIKWSIKEYIQPQIHQICLLYCLPERWYAINDPRTLLMCTNICKSDYSIRKKKISNYLNDIEKIIIKEFNSDIKVKKLIICGDEKYKLRAVLSSLNVEIVILGPDTLTDGLSKYFKKSLDEFVTNDINIPVLRVPDFRKSKKGGFYL